MDQPQSIETMYRIGKGNWDAFSLSLGQVIDIAGSWAEAFDDIDLPWLCWSVDHDWSIVQQRLVASVGWTPVVGFDPRTGSPPTVPEALVIDFNAKLGLPTLFPHFVIEFVFAFADKLAFWHSDLLLNERDMAIFASAFAELEDGATMAVPSPSGWRGIIAGRARRYWELLGCTTRQASRSQYERGCGWWMHYSKHPNFRGRSRRDHHWECGCGIYYWKKYYNGQVIDINEDRVAYGHFTRCGNENYVADQKNDVFRDLNKDMQRNYDLRDCAASLNLAHLLPGGMTTSEDSPPGSVTR